MGQKKGPDGARLFNVIKCFNGTDSPARTGDPQIHNLVL